MSRPEIRNTRQFNMLKGTSGKCYTVEELKLAVRDVKTGRLTAWQAHRKYGIPHSTIYSQAKGWANRPAPAVIGRAKGRPTALAEETEAAIARCLATMNKWGFALNKDHLLDCVQSFVKQNNSSTPFQDGRPGWKWFRAFMHRCNLKLKVAQNIEASRFRQQKDPFVIYGFYDLLEEQYTILEVWKKPESIYNLDETSVRFDPTRTKVIAPVGENAKRQINGSGKESTTVLACVSASGHILPPHVLFAGKLVQQSWLDEDLKKYPGTSVDVTDNGWMTQDSFYRWFKNVFVKEVTVRPCILIFDGHVSHISTDIITKALDENIVIIKLPPHTTHILQPIDVSFFRPFKVAWEKNVAKFNRTSHGKPMGKTRFLEEIGSVWSTLSGNICSAGFKKAGIFPLNKFAIPESCFDPNAVKRYQKLKEQKGNVVEKSDLNKSESNDLVENEEPEVSIDIVENSTAIYNDVFCNENLVPDSCFPATTNSDRPASSNFQIQHHESDNLILEDSFPVTTNADCPTTSNFLSQYQECDTMAIPHGFSHKVDALIMCDVSTQTNLILDRDISDEDFSFLQQMNAYFKRLKGTNSLNSVQRQFAMPTELSPEAKSSHGFESCLLKTISSTYQSSTRKRKAVGSNFAECLTTEAYLKKMKEENINKEQKQRKKIEKQEQVKVKKAKTAQQTKPTTKIPQKLQHTAEKENNKKPLSIPNLPGVSGSSLVSTSAQLQEEEIEVRNENASQKKPIGTRKKTSKPRRKIKKKDETETSTDDDDFSLHSNSSSLCDEDFSSRNNSNLSNINEESESSDNIKVGSYVIVEYEGEFFPGIVSSKWNNEVEVSTMAMSGPKSWKWPDQCDKIFYKLDKIKEIIMLPEMLNSRNNYCVPEMDKYRKFSS